MRVVLSVPDFERGSGGNLLLQSASKGSHLGNSVRLHMASRARDHVVAFEQNDRNCPATKLAFSITRRKSIGRKFPKSSGIDAILLNGRCGDERRFVPLLLVRPG